MINFLLKIPSIRKKVLHRIKYNYFNELNISIPLKNNYWADLMQTDSYDSFSEIFIHNEYEGFIPDIEIKSLIDLGAHHGFFSVWLQSSLKNVKLKTLLVEPSARCAPILKQLLERNEYKENFVFINKCIGNPDDGETLFFDRPHMASSNFKTDESEIAEKVSVLTTNDICQWQNPPYDLLKCDIEGAEWDLIDYYGNILKKTKFVVIEWHEEQGEFDKFVNQISGLGFSIIKSSQVASSQPKGNSTGLLLIKNNRF
jgi:FkbM family methyltransferase